MCHLHSVCQKGHPQAACSPGTAAGFWRPDKKPAKIYLAKKSLSDCVQACTIPLLPHGGAILFHVYDDKCRWFITGSFVVSLYLYVEVGMQRGSVDSAQACWRICDRKQNMCSVCLCAHMCVCEHFGNSRKQTTLWGRANGKLLVPGHLSVQTSSSALQLLISLIQHTPYSILINPHKITVWCFNVHWSGITLWPPA